jgi:hypothetical protein
VKQISIQQLKSYLNQLTFRETEIYFVQDGVFLDIKKLSRFNWCEESDSLIFYSNDGKIIVLQNTIKEIHINGDDIKGMHIIIMMNNEIQCQIICTQVFPICCECGEEFDPQSNNDWNISDQGKYGTEMDGDNVELHFCDKCIKKKLASKQA